jgi:hypothetical protein
MAVERDVDALPTGIGGRRCDRQLDLKLRGVDMMTNGRLVTGRSRVAVNVGPG